MNNWILLGIQVSISTLAYALIFFWYVQPRLAKLPFETAVEPMLLVHLFRFAGLTLLVVGQTDPSVSRTTLEAIAYGDMLATISALIAVLALHRRSVLALPLIWLFSIIGIADLANVRSAGPQCGSFQSLCGGDVVGRNGIFPDRHHLTHIHFVPATHQTKRRPRNECRQSLIATKPCYHVHTEGIWS